MLKLIDATLATDTNALADGDVASATSPVQLNELMPGCAALLESLTLLDMSDSGVAIDLVFLRANQSLGALNGPPDISDANAADVLGLVSIAGGDYVDLVNSRVATKRDLNLVLKPLQGSSIYVAAIARGAVTYAADSLRLRLGLRYA